jgi:hypothetical protein
MKVEIMWEAMHTKRRHTQIQSVVQIQTAAAAELGVVAVGTTPLAPLAGLVAELVDELGLVAEPVLPVADEATLVVASNTLPIDRTLDRLITMADINIPALLPVGLVAGMG